MATVRACISALDSSFDLPETARFGWTDPDPLGLDPTGHVGEARKGKELPCGSALGAVCGNGDRFLFMKVTDSEGQE